MAGRSNKNVLLKSRAIIRLSYVQGFMRATRPMAERSGVEDVYYVTEWRDVFMADPRLHRALLDPLHNMRHCKSVSGFQPLQKNLLAVCNYTLLQLAGEGDVRTRRPLCLGRVLCARYGEAPAACAACETLFSFCSLSFFALSKGRL